MKVALKFPIQFNGTDYDAITIRPPTVGDHLNISHIAGEYIHRNALMANIAEVEPELIDELDMSDINKIQEKINELSTPENEGYKLAVKGSIKLRYPLDDIDEVTLRRPKGKDYTALDGMGLSDAEFEAHLMAALASLSIDSLRQIAMADYQKLQHRFQSFLA